MCVDVFDDDPPWRKWRVTQLLNSTFLNYSCLFQICISFSNISLSQVSEYSLCWFHWFHWLHQAAVNHTQFFPPQKNSPSSHNSPLDMESAVAPAGLHTCFIHRSSNGAIQKAVIFSHCSPFYKPGESDGSPAEQNLFLCFPVISRWKKI